MKSLVKIIALGALLSTAYGANAAVMVGVDPGAKWLGFMNVFNLPADGGGYQFGSAWGTADLTANFVGPDLVLGPNTIGDPSPYWYIGGGGPGAQGNKIMDANFYVEDTPGLAGNTVNFKGLVDSNDLVAPFTSVAFIKDFVPDYSSFVQVTSPLAGAFDISLATQSGHHVQYGFETVGPCVWVTDVARYGSVKIQTQAPGAIPEPSTLALLASSAAGLLAFRRRKA